MILLTPIPIKILVVSSIFLAFCFARSPLTKILFPRQQTPWRAQLLGHLAHTHGQVRRHRRTLAVSKPFPAGSEERQHCLVLGLATWTAHRLTFIDILRQRRRGPLRFFPAPSGSRRADYFE